jgi:hypothetical protein
VMNACVCVDQKAEIDFPRFFSLSLLARCKGRIETH